MRAGLADRRAESTALTAFLDRTLSKPGVLVLEGEAGIGKSTLLWEAAEAATERGFRVLSASGAPTEVSYAYAAVADLLATVVIPGDLPEAQRAALEQIQLGGGDGPAGNERMVATAFLAVIRASGSQAPVLLCIDDAHWLDASSQAVIGYAARRLTGRVGLLLAIRTGSVNPVDMSWLSAARPDAVVRLPIRPLTLGGVHTVVSARLGHTLPRPAITRIHEISGGNPFFALELARFISEAPEQSDVQLPDSLAALVRERIGQPDEEVAAVLLAAACAAFPTVQRVGLATELNPDRVVELIESTQARGVVQIDGSRIRFRHPLFATGVVHAAGPSARRAMHRRYSEFVHEPELKARHMALAATTNDPDAVEALDVAVEFTRTRGAPAVAAELIELAIKLGDDTPARRMRAAEQQFRSGAFASARTHLHSILDKASTSSELRCTALIALAAITGYEGSLVVAADLLTQAIDKAADYPLLQLQARLLMVPVARVIGHGQESIELANIAVAQADQLGIAGLRSQALTIQALVRFWFGQGLDPDSLQLAVDSEDPAGGPAAAYRAGVVAPVIRSWAGELVDAPGQIRALRQRLAEGGTETDILWMDDYAAMVELWLGNYGEAGAIADEAVQRAELMGTKMVLVCAWARQASVAAYTGRVDEARSVARTALEAARAIGDALHTAAVTATCAFLEVSLGDHAAAIKLLEPLLASFDPEHGTEIVVGSYLPDGVEALAAVGRATEAEPLVAALERNGARLDRPWMLAVGARGRSHLLAARGELNAAEQAAQEALRHHERLPMPFEKARTQLLLGQVQRRRRRRQVAEATLRAALETFELLGAPLWAQRARAELARLTRAAGGGGLTPAEHRVAQLAAAGLSNKQIAAELFIAPKTVEMALGSVYRKLGIRSRGGLFAALNAE
ncbi:helix-turn-helix transcriptional regulator [[Mycobacterium] zoologicum]|uniref:helix-turn-helix transcriptional regulator n=1 Tax=[Mycobacterium] zoologicum TaxID=2872311 RepID=UPI001CDA8607|nr:AAA family ATPase [Mycolicibacter sp. MYC101]MEB3062784.1 AAA family ATPase [Mycolicibacter sp. MYC101]